MFTKSHSSRRHMPRLMAACATMLVLALVAVACGDDEQSSQTAPATTAEAANNTSDSSDTADASDGGTDGSADGDADDGEAAATDDQPSSDPDPESPPMEPVRIGILFSNSGPAGIFGPPVANIAQFIEEDLNARGGLNGRPVEVYMADDATDPEIGRQAMEQLIDSDNVHVVLGTHSSATRAAVKPLAEAANVLYIYTALYEGGECSSVMFNTGEVPSQQLAPTIPWMMRETGGTRWFLVGNDYVWPRRSFELAREYIEAAGGEVVGEEYVPLGTQDFSTIAQQIANSDADLLFPALVGGDAIAFETQAVDFGIGQSAIPRLANIYEENVLGAMGPAVTAGMRVTLGYFKELDNDLNKAFVERYYDRFGADAAPHATFSSHIYDAALLYAAAVAASGSTDTSVVAAALEGLDGLSLTTPSGLIAITDSRHLSQPIYVMEVQPDGSQLIVETFESVIPDETCDPS